MVELLIETSKLNYLVDELPKFLSVMAESFANDYLARVLDQFRNTPSYWKPLDPRTVEHKRALRSQGQPVAFGTPEQVLVNYGLLRDSITIREYRHINTLTGRLPISFHIGIFRGAVAGRGRLRWAWQHEFGTRFLINVLGWRRRIAQGYFRRIVHSSVTYSFRSLTPLKIGKADIEGKMNIEKFVEAVRKLAIRMRKRVKVEKIVKQKYVDIPERSIFREALNRFRRDFVLGAYMSLRDFMLGMSKIIPDWQRIVI